MKFKVLAEKLASQRGAPVYGAPLLCLDPGRTTGWAFFKDGDLIAGDQIKTDDLQSSYPELVKLFSTYVPHILVVEDYRVYKWKTDQHTWSELYVSQLIGMIETLAVIESIPVVKQSAQIAKSFATDKNLETWGLWVPGKKHERDAIRHGCYFIIEGAEKCRNQERGRNTNPHRVG